LIDPKLVFTFWEITPRTLGGFFGRFGQLPLTLRLYEIREMLKEGEKTAYYRDIDVIERIGSWYIRLPSDGFRFCIDIGIKRSGDDFVAIERSNLISVPCNMASTFDADELSHPGGIDNRQEDSDIYNLLMLRDLFGHEYFDRYIKGNFG